MQVGVWQILVIIALVIILFGTKRIPQVMKDIGKGFKGLRDELSSDSDDARVPRKSIVKGSKSSNGNKAKARDGGNGYKKIAKKKAKKVK